MYHFFMEDVRILEQCCYQLPTYFFSQGKGYVFKPALNSSTAMFLSDWNWFLEKSLSNTILDVANFPF